MIEHLTQNQVDDYRRQQLRPAELLSVSDHLHECDVCRRRIEIAVERDSTFFALRSEIFGESIDLPELDGPHLTKSQIEYVDGNLVGEEHQMVVDHLSHCIQCSRAIDDLRVFREQVGSTLDREYGPASTAAKSPGWWGQVVASLLAPFRGYPIVAYGTALMIILLAITGWLLWRTKQAGPPKEELVVAPSPSPSPPEAVRPTAQIVARLNDNNGELTLDQEGNLSGAGGLPESYQSLLKQALTRQKLEASAQLKGLARSPSSLMSSDKERREFSVIEPFGKVLMTDRPSFRWSPMEGATSYVAEVYDSDFNLMASSPQLTNPSWTATKPLPRGQVYSWQVKAIKSGEEFTSPRPPAPQARFRVLDQAKASELTKAMKSYPSSHLMLGMLYADAGLLTEAEQELRLLQKTNPDSEIARTLLGQIQGLMRKSK